MSKWQEEKKIVLEAAQKMLEKGLVVGTAGNVSLRLPSEGGRELLAITPSSRYYDVLSVDDIQIIDFEAKPVEGNLPPSAETMLHTGIYQARKNINAIIHTHSVFASAIAVAGLDIPAILDENNRRLRLLEESNRQAIEFNKDLEQRLLKRLNLRQQAAQLITDAPLQVEQSR